jgi:uncharacterized protein
MDITPLVAAGRQIIQSYSGGKFRISGTVHDGAVIVFADRTLPWTLSAPLALSDFAALIEARGDLDVVLFGAGGAVDAGTLALRRELKAAGLPVDVMDTGAACRTYNVLLAEGRRVAAALLPA